MANTTVGASVQVEFASVGQMRKAIKEATSDLIAMQEQFGKTSPQAIAAAKRIAELKDRIQDAKEQADLFDPGKRFSAFANAASQVAAGFSAVQGAMALVGSESEDLQKTLVKVQGAMALSQGLSQLADFGKAFDEIKVVAVNAFKSIRAAISSTGIGLLVVALGTIVAYWDDIKEAVSGVSEEQKKLNDESKKNLKTEQDKLDAINGQDNVLKLQGKTEKEILELKIKQYDQVIKTAKAQLVSEAEIQKAREKAAERNAEITKNIINGSLQISTAGLRLLAAPIDALILTANKVSKALGFGEITSTTLNEELSGIITKVSEFTTSFLFDPEKVRKEGEKANEEAIKNIKKLENDRDGLILQGRENDLANAKKTADDKAAFEKEYTKFLQDENAKRLKNQQDTFDQERTAIDQKYADLIAKAKKFGLDTTEIEGLRFQETKDLVNKDTAERQTNLSKQLGDFKAMVPQMATQQSAITVNQATEANTRKIINESEVESRRKMANDIAGILNGISDIFGKETAAGKATAIAAATINTYLAASQALTGIKKMNPFGAAIAIAQAALIVANGIRQVKAIASVQVPKVGGGGGGAIPSVSGGGGAPVSAEPTPTVTAQALNAQAINQLGNQSMRAYVLNSDITNNDQRNAYLERNARLG